MYFIFVFGCKYSSKEFKGVLSSRRKVLGK